MPRLDRFDRVVIEPKHPCPWCQLATVTVERDKLEALYREARAAGYDLSCPSRAWNEKTEKAIAAAKRGEPAQ